MKIHFRPLARGCAAFSLALSLMGGNMAPTAEAGDMGCSDMISGGAIGGEAFWVYADYLYWQVDGVGVPALVTASPVGTPLATAGALGAPTTAIIAGGDEINDDWRSGYRIGGGFWLDRCAGLAVIGDYFHAGRDSDGFSRGPEDGQIIARPFFNAQTGAPDAQLVNVPGELGGRVDVRAFTDFQGAGIGLSQILCASCDPCTGNMANLAVIGGYRYYKHDSVLTIAEDLTVLPGTTAPLVPGTTFDILDRFSARNEFHGGELGLQGRIERDAWFFDGLAAVAVGGNRRVVIVDGQTTTTVPGGGTTTAAGGLLTSEATNIGRYSDTDTSVIPRFRVGIGAYLTENLSIRTGYNVIILDDFVEAASHLPPGLAVDPRNLPPIQAGGGPDPRFPGLVGSTVVAHGLDFGLMLTF